jgi:hypothetical protein
VGPIPATQGEGLKIEGPLRGGDFIRALRSTEVTMSTSLLVHYSGGTLVGDLQKEHRIETFKSLIQISLEGLKLIALFNGGAAVALLAYLGNVAEKSATPPDMFLPMVGYAGGLLFCGLAFASSYLTQLRLYQESMGRSAKGVLSRHTFWLNADLILALVCLVAFGAASCLAALRLR